MLSYSNWHSTNVKTLDIHIWPLFLKYVNGINSWLSWMSHAVGFWTASILIKVSNQIIYSPHRRIFPKKAYFWISCYLPLNKLLVPPRLCLEKGHVLWCFPRGLALRGHFMGNSHPPDTCIVHMFKHLLDTPTLLGINHQQMKHTFPSACV